MEAHLPKQWPSDLCTPLGKRPEWPPKDKQDAALFSGESTLLDPCNSTTQFIQSSLVSILEQYLSTRALAEAEQLLRLLRLGESS